MDHEGTTISQGFIQEEKSRSLLWKIEKERAYASENCPSCAKSLSVQVTFETATLQTEKIPAARLRLEALAREVQESYCHHQHTALMTYYQIEDLVYMTIQSGMGEIREALSLLLQAMRLSDGASEVYSASLQRWVVALAAKLVYTRDLRHLIFLIRHLFRQNRSVRWASRVLRVQVTDVCSAARAIALLELILARPGLETAVECTEELVEGWEEVGRSGEGSAVGEGLLRERDALALLRALPLRQLLAKMALFNRSDIESTEEHEWGDGSGGHGVLKAACGARALLAVLQRAVHAHAHYARLQRELTELCACALQLVAALHLRSRHVYHPEVAERVQVELEAVFVAGLLLHQGKDLTKLPATLLSEATARDYCFGLIATLHDKGPHRIASLDVDVGVVRCDVRVLVVLQAALDRADDHELARTLLQFLCQTAVKRKPQWCRQPCEVTARESLPRLLAVHPYLHAISLHVLADLNQGEPVDPTAVSYLSVQEWRPNYAEVLGVLEDWSVKCPHLIEHLLLQMEYTPHQGVSLETQLAMGAWLCEYVRRVGGEVREWAWSVLERLHVHRAQWAICSVGVRALVGVARVRPGVAARCLVSMMRAVQHTPESVALTPEFTEVFNVLLGSGPSLMARAFGRAGPATAELLEKALLNELLSSQSQNPGILNPWLRGLWAPTLPSSARALLDTAVRAVEDVPAIDTVVSLMLQGENSKEFLDDAVRNCSVAPLLCEAALRGAHAQYELSAHMWPRLTDAVARQRAHGHKVHVDNAIKQIGCTISSEELVVYRTASAVLSAPLRHPSHLTLWRLFFHLYLQRPPSSPQLTSIPVGPLFFSGIIKSRVLSQLKKRLQEVIDYHKIQSEQLKIEVYPQTEQIPTTSDSRKTNITKTYDRKLFAPITINDLIEEECRNDSESESSEEEITEERVSESSATREKFHLYCYHSGAVKMLSEYGSWLSDGDKTRAAPHHADIARFIQHEGLSAARRNSLPVWFVSATPPRPHAPPTQPTPLQRAIDALLQIKEARALSPLPDIQPLLDEHNNLSDARVIYNLVDRHLRTMESDAQSWSREVSQLSQLDSKLLELLRALRVRRPLPTYTKWCGNDTCKPIKITLQVYFHCNRRCALAALRALSRPRPSTARVAATLQSLVRVVRSRETAVRVAERAGNSAAAVHSFPPAIDAITSLVTHLAERWVCGDAGACGRLLRAWAGGGAHALCSALVQPRRLDHTSFLELYHTVLTASLPPPAAFSYLSRFEMATWAERVDPVQREKMLDILVQAAQRWGPAPEPEHHVLLELIGVHIGLVCGVGEVCALVVGGLRACARGSLPPTLCAHLTHAAAHAHALTYNQLGNLLREVGAIWWETRTSLTEETNLYVPYASHLADILQVLQQDFTAATKALGHDTERVSWFAWSVLREAWAPWVQPGTPPPLLPVTHSEDSNAHADMLQRFRETLQLLIDGCPGSEEYVLRHVWEWAVHTYIGAGARAPQSCRVSLSALLSALESLPWHTVQWMHASCMPLALQISRCSDREIVSWCGARWRCACAASWVRGVQDAHLAPHLAALLSVFCSPQLQLDTQVLEEAALLPWQRLPEAALDAAFEQFFVDFHNPAFPYHETMQFRLLLCASQLIIVGETPECGVGARARRARSVSQCVRAAATPTLTQHARAHAETMLRVLTDLGSEGGGWCALRTRLCACAWGGGAAGAAGVRRGWHAASDDEPIMAVWVCVLCRTALQSRRVTAVSADMSECVEVSRGVLVRWAAEPRRSLLQLVAMHHDTHTVRIRLLCRLALCILDPSSEEFVKAYEASCSALPPGQVEAVSWGRAPGAKYLPRLAAMLYPGRDVYFDEEAKLLQQIT
ncbi:hypothetical protein RR48_05239 [Papilio machaon]|uniref:Ectopic P granules protein 5-like n=1 Tax=Papilio machaon TaxID=76193 RepID=A0A0N1PGJ9_PAPMA|nr:hypothetical protein RR48_05239 [Papilio machaon]